MCLIRAWTSSRDRDDLDELVQVCLIRAWTSSRDREDLDELVQVCLIRAGPLLEIMKSLMSWFRCV